MKSFPLRVLTVFLLLCSLQMDLTESVVAKRKKMTIVEAEESELASIVTNEDFVAVLYHDTSKLSIKTLSDLQLIKADAEAFGISMRRLQSAPPSELLIDAETIPPSLLVLYMYGEPIIFPGRPDRQTAALRWMITHMFCNLDRPLEVDMAQFEILTRSFRNFVLIAHTLGSKKSRQLMSEFHQETDLCNKVDGTLIVSSRDEAVFETVGLSDLSGLPAIFNLVHGVSIEFVEEAEERVPLILDWISKAEHGRVRKILQPDVLRTIMKREDLLLVLCLDDKKHNALAAQLKVSLSELETQYALAVITVNQLNVTMPVLGVKDFPAFVLFENSGSRGKRYQGRVTGEDAAIEIKHWVAKQIETRDKYVIKAIESSEFKSNPNDFKNVLLKEHKDAFQKLSTEYAKLLKQNIQLRAIINDAKKTLNLMESGSNNSNKGEEESECGDCMAAVGQALWNCGTFEVECIKNALELKSDCFGCVCEIIDTWWPEDAPNCFKKEIRTITKKEGGGVKENMRVLPDMRATKAEL